MSLASTLAAGRRAQRSRMVDTFDIGVPTGGWRYDEALGRDVETIQPLVTTPGYFAGGALEVRAAEAGDRTVHEVTAELRIPWDAPTVPSNAVAVCTAIGPDTPPRMLGRRVRVDGSGGDGSQRTYYPLQVTEVLS